MQSKIKRFVNFRYISLLLLFFLSIWAFLPSPEETTGSAKSDKAIAHSKTPKASKKYHLRIAPDYYLPGLTQMNVGNPLNEMNVVKEKFEALYPDTEIEYVGAPTSLREWLVTQLSARTAPDIFQVNVEDVWQDVHKGWYLPLDEYLEKPNPFVKPGELGSKQWWDVFKYENITRGKAAPDGKMYCIPLDMVETAVFYNKTIFKEQGLEPPKDWVEFLAIQKKLKQAGYVPFATFIDNMVDWGMDLVFDQYYAQLLPGIDLFKDPKREVYLDGYLDWDEISYLYQKGFFHPNDPRWVQMWRTLKEWRQYCNRDLSPACDPMRQFLTHKAAMMWNGSWSVYKLVNDPDVDFEWDVFYPPPIPSSYCEYADGHTMCVIGGAAMQYSISNSAWTDTDDPKTSEKLKRCVAFLQFLTLPENGGKVVNEVTVFLPNIKGTEPHKELLPFDDILRRPYTTTKWYFTFDLKFNEIMKRGLELYLNDGISEKEFLQLIDKNLNSAIQNVTERKKLNLNQFDSSWNALEPYRRQQKDLPHNDQGH